MNSVTNSFLKDRETVICTLPASNGVQFLLPEQVMLKMKGTTVLSDIGSLCYLRRSFLRKMRKGRRVDPASLDIERQEHVRTVLKNLTVHAMSGTRRPTTLYTEIGYYITFMDWCDQTGRHRAVRSEEELRHALKFYVAALREKIQKHEISTNTAAGYQTGLISFMESVTGWDDLGIGINLVRRRNSLKESTHVPDEMAVSKVIAWSECVLKGFSELLINAAPYPFSLQVPGHLRQPDDRIWVFPTNTWSVIDPNSNKRISKYADYGNGLIRSPEEFLGPKNNKARSEARRTQRLLTHANEDLYHISRIKWRASRIRLEIGCRHISRILT